jgi:hypothetical protein
MHVPHPSHMGAYKHLPDVPNMLCISCIFGSALCHLIVCRMSTGGMSIVQSYWSQQVLTYLNCVERVVIQNPWVSEEKAVGHPLALDLGMGYYLDMWPWLIVGTKNVVVELS